MSPLPLRSAALGLLALLALPLAAAPAAAQAPSSLPAGERLRIRTPEGRDTYRLIGTAGDTLLLRRSGRADAERISLASVERLERSLGRHSRWHGFGRGVLVGGLSGLALGTVVGLAQPDDEADFIISDEAATALLALTGGISFGVAGGVLGAMMPGERWETVRAERRVSVAPMHGGLGVRVAF